MKLKALYIIIIIALASYPVSVLIVDYVDHRRAILPDGVDTLEEFIEWHRNIKAMWIIRKDNADGEEHLAIVGPVARLGSGPSVYVFNRNKGLVDWTVDRGDDPSFAETWPWSDTPLGPSDVRAWFNDDAQESEE